MTADPRILCVYILPTSGDQAHWYAQRGKEFAESYYAHDPGAAHDLLVVVKHDLVGKAFAKVEWASYFTKMVIHPNAGWDIGSWFEVARASAEYDYIVCLGANSRILADNWLKYMLTLAECDHVGMVGTTASFEAGITRQFPNPHIRSSGFMIKPEMLLSVWRPTDTKQDCYEFEHGLNSMYRQIREANLLCPIVGADGMPYFEESWATCGIFRQGDQANLLIADNQTDTFMASTEEERLVLSLMAGWHP